SVSLPLQDEGWSSFWLVMFWILPGWSFVGVGIAFLIEVAGAKLERALPIVACMIGSALFFSAVYSSIYSIDVGPLSRLSTIFPQGTDPFASFAYQTWVILFYGGFYYIAWRL